MERNKLKELYFKGKKNECGCIWDSSSVSLTFSIMYCYKQEWQMIAQYVVSCSELFSGSIWTMMRLTWTNDVVLKSYRVFVLGIRKINKRELNVAIFFKLSFGNLLISKF